MINVNSLLELTNGAWSVLGAFLLFALIRYLLIEHKTRHLSQRDWLAGLPISMQLAVGILVVIAGLTLNSFVLSIWRATTGGGPLQVPYATMVGIGRGVVCLGMLCLIRVITRPHYGNRIWMASTAAVFIYITAMLTYRAA